MKFLYEFRTSDNVRHDGVVSAASRDAAFSLLKSQGIRPSRLSEAPGFANKLLGKGKRWLAIGTLSVLTLIMAVMLIRYRYDLESAPPISKDIADSLLSNTRRQLIGDGALIDYCIRNGWSNVFDGEGERFLASFAIPGVDAGQRNTTEEELCAALKRRVDVRPDDGIEVRQIKAMVEGMKEEARKFIAAGGSAVLYGQKIVERQEAEKRYFSFAKSELERAVGEGRSQVEIEVLWGKLNSQLRQMGIRSLPLPDERK